MVTIGVVVVVMWRKNRPTKYSIERAEKRQQRRDSIRFSNPISGQSVCDTEVTGVTVSVALLVRAGSV